MADRADIRDAFTSELTAVSGTYDITDTDGSVVDTVTLDASAIGLREPSEETIPAVVYYDNYVKNNYNGVGTAPDHVERDNSGVVQYEEHREYIEAQFIIDVRAPSDMSKEPIYEQLRRVFGKYQFEPWSPSDLHADVIGVRVEDSTDIDTGDTEQTIRGDQIEVYIEFHRDYRHTAETIETVSQTVTRSDE